MRNSTILFKRIAAFILALTLLFTLAGCGDTIDSNPGSTGDAQVTQPANTPDDTTASVPEDTTPSDASAAPVIAVNSELNDPISDNGYNYMMEKMKDPRYQQVIMQVLEGIKNFETVVRVDPIIEVDETMDFAQYILPTLAVEYCYVDHIGASVYGEGSENAGKLAKVSINYHVETVDAGLQMVNDLRGAANEILMGVDPSWSDYDKIKYLHDQLVLKSAPDINNVGGQWGANAYGALVDGRPTCLGYAKAMFYLLTKSGYDTIFAVGTGHEARHIWVKVKLGDKWYNIDPTWDDPVSYAENDPEYIGYDYFLVSDEFMKRTHAEVFDMRFYDNPAATDETLCWHAVNGLVAGSVEEALAIVKKQTEEAVAHGGNQEYVRVKFTDEATYKAFSDAYTKAVYNSDILAPVSSEYTCNEKYLGSKTWLLNYSIVK